jgi:hypothetical protein
VGKDKDLFTGGKNDPDQYRKCSEPFATAEEANAAVQAFWEEAYELRVKHNLANVSFVIGDSIAESGEFFVCNHIGTSIMWEGMAALMYGQASAARQASVRAMLSEGARDSVKGAENKR